jgi:hypothetical protein
MIGVLPKALARPLLRLEPYGLVLPIGLLIVLPILGAHFGLNLDFLSLVITRSARAIIAAILHLAAII